MIILETAIFDGQNALTDCNTFLQSKARSEIVSVTPVYNVGSSEMNYHVVYSLEV